MCIYCGFQIEKLNHASVWTQNAQTFLAPIISRFAVVNLVLLLLLVESALVSYPFADASIRQRALDEITKEISAQPMDCSLPLSSPLPSTSAGE